MEVLQLPPRESRRTDVIIKVEVFASYPARVALQRLVACRGNIDDDVGPDRMCRTGCYPARVLQ